MTNAFKYIYIYISLTLFASCSLLNNAGPQPHTVYERPELTNKVEKLIIFPTTDFQGNDTSSSKAIDAAVNASWTNFYGKNTVIPAGLIVKKVIDSSGKDSYGKFISTLDNVSTIEQVMNGTKVQDLLKSVTDQLSKQTNGKSKFHIALAIISGGEEEYNKGDSVFLHIGLFDVSSLTWKIITKVEIKKGNSPLSNWKIDSQLAVKNSFKFLEFIKTEGAESESK